MDFAVQRKNMVESQVRPNDITDRRILRAMLEVPREEFVPAATRELAYMDGAVTLPPARHNHVERALMAPRTFSKLLQLAAIEPHETVLDVGAATGYSAAILARLAGTVVALESNPGLADMARRTLARLSCANAQVIVGDLPAGFPQQGPYDVILLEGSVPERPLALLDQLKDGGRALGVVHARDGKGLGKAVVWRRSGSAISELSQFDGDAPPLPGFERQPVFEL